MIRWLAGQAAQQMRAAYDNVIGEGWKQVAHPAMAPFAFGAKRFQTEERRGD
jgi:hypothetical protein